MKSELGEELKICSKCIYDERVPSISFDQDGVCNYCSQADKLIDEFGTGKEKGKAKLKAIIQQIKKHGQGKKYDCIIGVSGGTDSSYMLHLMKNKWKLRPLAVHYDNTWNTSTATQNLRKVLSKLNVDLYTHVVSNTESNKIFSAFFKSGVAEIEAATDLALAEVMYQAAWKNKIKYVFEGHSFVTEGITPIGRNYFDGKYIKSICKNHGLKKFKSYPLMTFWRFLFWVMAVRIKKIRPFWYIDYSKEDARKLLEKEYEWEYYGGHHLENRMTAFYHTIYLPEKFNQDMRNNTLSALVRNKKLDRKQAWCEYVNRPECDRRLISFFKKRLKISDGEFDEIMLSEPKSWKDFPTYKKRFELLRPIFHILAKKDLVPMSFYLKYCFPSKEDL